MYKKGDNLTYLGPDIWITLGEYSSVALNKWCNYVVDSASSFDFTVRSLTFRQDSDAWQRGVKTGDWIVTKFSTRLYCVESVSSSGIKTKAFGTELQRLANTIGYNLEDCIVVNLSQHKDYEVMTAWAEGKPVQLQVVTAEGWLDSVNPMWGSFGDKHTVYRIKPEEILSGDWVKNLSTGQLRYVVKTTEHELMFFQQPGIWVLKKHYVKTDVTNHRHYALMLRWLMGYEIALDGAVTGHSFLDWTADRYKEVTLKTVRWCAFSQGLRHSMPPNLELEFIGDKLVAARVIKNV